MIFLNGIYSPLGTPGPITVYLGQSTPATQNLQSSHIHGEILQSSVSCRCYEDICTGVRGKAHLLGAMSALTGRSSMRGQFVRGKRCLNIFDPDASHGCFRISNANKTNASASQQSSAHIQFPTHRAHYLPLYPTLPPAPSTSHLP